MSGRPTVDRQLVLAVKRRGDRSTVDRLAEVRGWVGGHRAPHRTVTLRTADGLRLAASWLPGPSADAPTVVLAHGFAAHRRKPAYAFMADHLAGSCNVLSLDLRGHGQSQGRCELGSAEWQDVQAAVEALRRRGHDRVVGLGLSLGGTSIAHALARGVEMDGAVLVSSSARHWDLTLPGMADLHRLVHSRPKRLAWQALARFRVRPPGEIPTYPDPVELVATTQVPLLVVHGADDAYFGAEHAHQLVAAAGGPAVLWEEPAGFGHAEDGVTPAWCQRISQAVAEVTRTGRFPPTPFL